MKWILILLTALLPLVSLGQAADEPNPKPNPTPEKKAPDPADTYFQAWSLSRDAEKLRKEGVADEAQEKMVRALKLFRTVQKQWPEWRKEMVKGRLVQTEEILKEWGWKEDEVI
ncbi:hypothetical protein [Luteolibacter sp. Populi]|uniref:hypothetical protein n=1 Tax=Luteolibacter sp. Populi TaxID=3230487 RepID=UPI00346685AA